MAASGSSTETPTPAEVETGTVPGEAGPTSPPKRRKNAPKREALLAWYDALPAHVRKHTPNHLAELYDLDHPTLEGKDQGRYARKVFANPDKYREK